MQRQWMLQWFPKALFSPKPFGEVAMNADEEAVKMLKETEKERHETQEAAS